jgi:rod shape determining protein RodA
MTPRLLSRIDLPMLLLIGMLLVVGVVNIHSASSDIGGEALSGFAFRQVFWIGIALAVLFFILLVPYRRIGRYAYLGYAAALLLLAVTLLFPAVKGSRRWIAVGPIHLQTSELMKVVLTIALARCLAVRKLERASELIVPTLLVAVPMILIFLQPDFGTAALLVPLLLAMLYTAGLPRRTFLALVIVGLHCLPVLYFTLKPHQKARIRAYVLQTELSQTQKRGEAYQSQQSKIAVGAGGWFGKGWRKGSQNRLGFVPERHNDFVFSVLCEEWGFVGAAVLLGSYLLLFLIGLGAAQATRDPFGRLLAVGLITILATQVLVNTSMTIGLVPITGLTLPLVSYGGSSLVTSMLAIGLVMNVKMRRVTE